MKSFVNKKSARKEAMVFLIPVIILAIFAGTVLSKNQDDTIMDLTETYLQKTVENQQQSAVAILDSIGLILNESTSEINFINIGLSTNDEDEIIDSALACQALRRITDLSNVINSMYLIDNVNKIVYTSSGIEYSIDAFYDMGWQGQYHNSQGGLQLLDKVRTINTISRSTENCISMISQVPFFSMLHEKQLICNFSIDDIAEQIISDTENNKSTQIENLLWIYNSNGDLIYDQAGSDAPDSYQVLEKNIDANDYIVTDSSKYFVKAIVDTSYGWHYLQVIPYSYIYNLLIRSRLFIWGGVAVLVIIIIVAWMLRNYFYFKYERSLMNSVSKTVAITPDNNEECLSYLIRVIRQKTEECDASKCILDEFSNVIHENLAMQLINGELTPDNVNSSQKNLMIRDGLTQKDGQAYVVLLARINAISALKHNMHQDVYDHLRRNLQLNCDDLMPEGFYAYYAWPDHSLMAAIIRFTITEGNNSQYEKQMDLLGASIQKELTFLSEQPVVIAFGEATDNPWNLNLSYETAKKLIQHKIYYNKEIPYRYSEKELFDLQMDYDHRKQLINQIKMGKINEASEILESYFTMLHNNPFLKLDYSIKLATQIAEAIHKATLDKKDLIEAQYADIDEIKKSIAQNDTVHDICDYILAYAQSVAQTFQESHKNKKKIRVQDVLDWINENYNQDIGLEDVAQKMGLSTAYASKQIKAFTGINVITYINNLRIEHAKELLETTKITSNEIALRVGFRYVQSFVRNFIKVTGITPGNYRELHRKSTNVATKQKADDQLQKRRAAGENSSPP